MTNPVTPNLGLNKIDRTSPSTTYFDLEKYIDQNADAVDRFAGETSDGVAALEKRLDTEERREVVLQPGLQIVNAERSAPFKLSGIKGRTLVNLLGYNGAFNSTAGWRSWATKTPITVSDNMVTFIGDGSGINPQLITKIVSSSSIQVGDKLFIRTKAQAKEACNAVSTYLYSSVAQIIYGQAKQDNPTPGKTYDVYHSFTVTQEIFDNLGDMTFRLTTWYPTKEDALNKTSVYSQPALYKVAADDLGLTDDQLAAKYPYIESVQPVRNPYAIRYGENLLPPFYEWTPIGITEGSLTGPYAANFKVTNSQRAFYYIDLKLLANTRYTFSAEHNGFLSVTDLVRETIILDNTSEQSATFTNINETTVRVYLSNVYGTAINGSYSFKNPMLTLGSEAKLFKPREDSMLALQTDLYSNPVTGTFADEVFEKDGQFFKMTKWKKVVLDTSYGWEISSNSFADHKIVRVLDIIPGGVPNDAYMKERSLLTDFRGVPLSYSTGNGSTWTTTSYQLWNNVLYVAIPNADSGWGASYTPKPDEIKAYFMGWKMQPYSGARLDQYNGTGEKTWYPISRIYDIYDASYQIRANVPTVPANNNEMWTPYQLVYQVATPTFEPIVSEGVLTFNEGYNQIEVGTGIVVKESNKPGYLKSYGAYYFNDTANNSAFSFKVDKILCLYNNGYIEPRAHVYSSVNQYGNQKAQLIESDYDPSAAYSVTYLMLDKSPIVQFTGSYTANEKAILNELTDYLQQNSTAISVLMNKKADKDAPGWITPTLLNGWIRESTTFGYIKDSVGNVRFRGRISSGTVATGTLLFTLPVGMRPSVYSYYLVSVYSGTSPVTTGYIMINIDGTVVVSYLPGNTWVNWDSVSFYAGN